MIYQRREQHRTRFTTWPYTISLRIFRTDQPLIQDDRLVGAEALLRWKHPIRGSVPPNDFIPLAEDTGLILPVGKWVLRQAFAQAAAWYRCSSTQHLCVAINLSARQIKHPDFIDHVLEEVQTSGVNPRLVEFELTETVLVENIEDTATKMTALQNHGFRFSLDDFGTGYSSLSCLHKLPPNKS